MNQPSTHQASPAQPVATLEQRFDRNEIAFCIGLILMMIGIATLVGWGWAALITGAVLSAVSVASSFFVTWLSRSSDVEEGTDRVA